MEPLVAARFMYRSVAGVYMSNKWVRYRMRLSRIQAAPEEGWPRVGWT